MILEDTVKNNICITFWRTMKQKAEHMLFSFLIFFPNEMARVKFCAKFLANSFIWLDRCTQFTATGSRGVIWDEGLTGLRTKPPFFFGYPVINKSVVFAYRTTRCREYLATRSNFIASSDREAANFGNSFELKLSSDSTLLLFVKEEKTWSWDWKLNGQRRIKTAKMSEMTISTQGS